MLILGTFSLVYRDVILELVMAPGQLKNGLLLPDESGFQMVKVVLIFKTRLQFRVHSGLFFETLLKNLT